MNRIAIAVVSCVAAVGTIGLLSAPVSAEVDPGRTLSATTSAAGVYHSELDVAGVATIRSIATLHADGTVSAADSTDANGDPLFPGMDSAGHGLWEIRGGVYRAQTVYMAYDALGTHSGWGRVSFEIELEGGIGQLVETGGAGVYSVELFGATEDPFGPRRTPVLAGTYETRMMQFVD